MSDRPAPVVSTVVYVCTFVLAWGAAALAAQDPPAPAQPPPVSTAKWEIEFHAGGVFGTTPTVGSAITAFPVGEAFTAPGVFGRPSRYASTWYFGDGATLLNQIAAGFGAVPVTSRIASLDPVLTRGSLERKRNAAFGFRVSRRLTSRFGAEFSVDSHGETYRFTDAAVSGIEATRASFEPVWDGIIATGAGGLFTNGATSSTTTLANATRRRTNLTGALTIALTQGSRFEPYVTGGGGVSFRTGDLPTATLTGNYRFLFLGIAPLDESDAVRVHFTARDTVAVGVVGGGLKYAISPRQGLRVDARVHFSPNAIDTLVDARPSLVPGTPAFVIPSTTTPAIVFSNTSTTRGNLTGPSIVDLKTFSGSGLDIQSSVTVGYFVRFPAVAMPDRQGAPATQAPRVASSAHRWELEAHVGGAFGDHPTTGTRIAAFPVGEPFTIFLGQSRYASTWYFGDGAVLINQIAAGFTGSQAAGTRVTPLDPVLTAASLERDRGAGFGVRLTRRLKPSWLSGELSVDSFGGSLRMTSGTLNGLEAARASFTTMWNALIATGSNIFIGPGVSSATTLRERTDSRQTLVTGAAHVELPGTARLTPYVIGGGGVLIRSGDLPTATLTGNYQFRFLGQAPFNQSDVATLRYEAKKNAPVGLFGGGVKYAFAARHGLRADVRVHIASNSIDTLVDATPQFVTGSPVFSISSGTTPTLVFSNTPTTRPNLTGAPIAGLRTFTGSGWDVQTNLTVGYFVRF